jgi:hypothetical protein
MSLHLFSGENESAELKNFSAEAKMTFVEFSKTNNANQIAKETIKNHAESSHHTQQEFIDYLLNEAPEKIRLLYAIQILGKESFVVQTSSGLYEQYAGNCLALLRQRVSLIEKQSGSNKKLENKSQ